MDDKKRSLSSSRQIIFHGQSDSDGREGRYGIFVEQPVMRANALRAVRSMAYRVSAGMNETALTRP